MSRRYFNRQLFSTAICGLASLLCLTTGMAGAAGGGTRPYFKVYGGNVFAGGSFNTSASNTDCVSNPLVPYQYSSGAGQAGGIFTYAGTSSAKGASGAYGVFATGPVEGNNTNLYGFYSGAATPSTNNYSTFANTASGTTWGGNFDGAAAQSDCIPDYYDAKQNNPQSCCNITAYGDSIDLNNANGQYIMTPGAGQRAVINPLGIPLNPSQKTTVFVNGDAYIAGNIAYPASYTESTVPKFALVVKGNIYVAPGVHQMDGLYIAQPSTSSNGVLWTCQDPSANSGTISVWFVNNCNSQLTINGAVIARQVNFTRIQGDVASAPANESLGSNNIAETINYIPAMVLGGAFFNPSSTADSYKPESIISLPPVF